MKEKFSKAEMICLDARKIFHEIQPPSYGEILLCQGILGDVLCKQNKSNEAEGFYHAAFEMGKKYLSFGDSRLINCINALANFYQKQYDTNYALQFCFEQLDEHKKYLSDRNHLNIAHIYMKIADLLNEKNFYRKAWEIFQKNPHQDYISNANCLLKLAQFCQHDQSLYCYIKANELYNKIYPPNHSSIINTQKQINKLKKMNIIQKSFDQDPIIIEDVTV
jgi:tetratricopeptide (TPR) repeat protein